MLGQIADAIVVGDADDAGIRFLLAGDHLKERRLAVAVPADKTDPLAGVDRKADVVEYHLSAV